MINNDETRTAITTTSAAEPEVRVSETNEAPQESSQEESDWRKVIIGGVTGIVLGAAGAYAAQKIDNPVIAEVEDDKNASEADSIKDSASKTEVHYEGKVPVAQSVNDEMSFGKAFAAAREEVGAGGVFEWRGNLYGTYTESEWNHMSSEDKNSYWQSVRGSQHKHQDEQDSHEEKMLKTEEIVKEENHTTDITSEKNTETAETKEEQVENLEEETAQVEQKEERIGEDVIAAQDEVEVALLGHEVVRLPDGSIADMGAVNINGHDAVVIDLDMDGNYDIIGADLDGDGQLSGDELAPLQPGAVTADDFDVAQKHMTSDDIFNDASDYNNDGDFNSFV